MPQPCHAEAPWRGLNIAQVLDLTVDNAFDVFADEHMVVRPLGLLRDIGLGYLRLGQPQNSLAARRTGSS